MWTCDAAFEFGMIFSSEILHQYSNSIMIFLLIWACEACVLLLPYHIYLGIFCSFVFLSSAIFREDMTFLKVIYTSVSGHFVLKTSYLHEKWRNSLVLLAIFPTFSWHHFPLKGKKRNLVVHLWHHCDEVEPPRFPVHIHSLKLIEKNFLCRRKNFRQQRFRQTQFPSQENISFWCEFKEENIALRMILHRMI